MVEVHGHRIESRVRILQDAQGAENRSAGAQMARAKRIVQAGQFVARRQKREQPSEMVRDRRRLAQRKERPYRVLERCAGAQGLRLFGRLTARRTSRIRSAPAARPLHPDIQTRRARDRAPRRRERRAARDPMSRSESVATAAARSTGRGQTRSSRTRTRRPTRRRTARRRAAGHRTTDTEHRRSAAPHAPRRRTEAAAVRPAPPGRADRPLDASPRASRAWRTRRPPPRDRAPCAPRPRCPG